MSGLPVEASEAVTGRNSPVTPRTKPTDKLPRVVRGGSWLHTSAAVVRAALRFNYTSLVRYDYIGVRCSQRGCKQPLKGEP